MTRARPVDELAIQLLRKGERLRVKARGASMVPFLWDGDVALVAPTAGTEIGVGDVVCYETSPGRLLLHRVIARGRDRFETKGDALAFAEVIEPRQLLGKVIAIERDGRLQRLDTRRARGLNLAIAAVSPLIPGLVPWGRRLRRVGRAVLRG